MLKKTICVLVMTALLGGCSATQTAIGKRELVVQTKMSDTIFLDPVAASKRTVFIQVRNTSDRPGLLVEQPIAQAIAAKGYKVVDDPEKAHYLLQANVLQAGIADARESEGSVERGFGAAVVGGAIGNQFGGGSGRAASTVGGGLIGLAVDAMVKDVYVSITTDIQISERSKAEVTERLDSNLKQGSSSVKRQVSTETTDMKRYQTRILSSANQVNLKYEEAEPKLVQGLVQSISGLL
jgi:uncharacterized protein YcfJ